MVIHRPLCKAFYNLLAYIVYDLFAKIKISKPTLVCLFKSILISFKTKQFAFNDYPLCEWISRYTVKWTFLKLPVRSQLSIFPINFFLRNVHTYIIIMFLMNDYLVNLDDNKTQHWFSYLHIYFITDPLNIISDDFGIWLLSYK